MPASLDQSPQAACHRESGTVLAAIPEAPSTCRSIVRAALRVHGLDVLAADAEVVVTEFASNAVRALRDEEAAGPPGDETPVLVLVLGWIPLGVRIEVWDRAPGTPQMREPDFEAECGRGLFLVNEITRGRWGCRKAGNAKCAWAELSEHQP